MNVRSSQQKNNCRCKRYFRENKKRVRFANCDCKDCKDFFRINPAGLNNHLNHKLLKFEDCPLEIVTDLGWRKRGKTHDIGIDFVDILSKNGLVFTVLKDKIDHICWASKDCKPHHHKCRKHDDCKKDCDCRKHDDWDKDCHCRKHDNWDKDCNCRKHDNCKKDCDCKDHYKW